MRPYNVTMTGPAPVPQAARDRLKAAMTLHERGDIDDAIAEARRALDIEPSFADARAYLGSTLIQRKGRYAEGLAELEQAREASPDDPAIYYTLGWCCEFVAHQVARRPRKGLDPEALYAQAERHLRRCLQLGPEGKMLDDAKDLLSSIIKEDVE